MPDSTMSTILMMALMVGVFYLLLIRPAQKRQKKQQEMVGALGTGSRVLTNAGVYATVVHMGEKQAVIEIAPGVEMTVLKQAILRVVAADEDEFEYADEAVEEFDLDVEAAVDDADTPLSFERPTDGNTNA